MNYPVLQGQVKHETKVTHLKGKGWGVRVYQDGKLVDETLVDNRVAIGPAIRAMLRMLDKCGNCSDMAHNSRMRPGRKPANYS
jgi:hypothetical protein